MVRSTKATWCLKKGLGLAAILGIAAGSGLSPTTAASLPGWPVVFAGAGESTDVARATSVDAAGNVYVTGSSADDIVTLKYNPAGQLLWSTRYAGPAGGLDSPAAIAVDEAGRVYVAGSSYGGFVPQGGTDYDLVVISYAANGTERWVERWDGPGSREDAATSMVRDNDGNLRIGGYAWTGLAGRDFAAWKYSPDGELLDTKLFDGQGDSDEAAAIAAGDDGAVYLTGASRGADTDLDYLTIRINAAGTIEWNRRYDSGSSAPDAATALSVRDGKLWVTGVSAGTGAEDCLTLQYSASSSGAHQWTHRFDGAAHGRDGGLTVRATANGEAFVAGYQGGANNEPDLLLLKLTPAGGLAWTRGYAGPGGKSDRARALVLDEREGVALSGVFSATSTNAGCLVQRYGPGGALRSEDFYLGSVSTPTGGLDLQRSGTGALAVVGSTWNAGGDLDIVTLGLARPVPAAPAVPTQLTGAFSEGGINLQWQDPTLGEAGFRVERSENARTFTQIAQLPPGATTHRDAAVTARRKYTYRLRSFNEAGASAPSAVVTIVASPPPPGKLVVTPARVSFGTVRVGRSAVRTITVRNAGRGALRVSWSLVGTGLALVSGPTTADLNAGKRTTFKVTFTPTAAGAVQGKVQFESTDPARPNYEVPVTAKGR